MFVAQTVVMASRAYTHQVVYIKYVKFFICQSCLNKELPRRRIPGDPNVA